MGCDIHVHVEIKVKGRWLHYNHPSVNRDYNLFTKMADVRNYDGEIQPISKPRGFPVDASETTKIDYDWLDSDAHSASWLSSKELVELSRWIDLQPGKPMNGINGIFGYLFGNGLDGFTLYPDQRPDFLEDVRLVFWFDN
jgi:hypothetical protein